ncbi:hypothetical protein [Paracoccus sanguinis]|uniref:Uncharacterized protein n=1 Tax=Paracoccus sanguinis TaxID=1545044 RepID=A0A099GLN2_9RHOB|nr:hypothetical protein [Paracoccus sanguinis]KGJ23765.1 hypothetical protein IX56_00370 [Paracoccus sanguinis]
MTDLVAIHTIQRAHQGRFVVHKPGARFSVDDAAQAEALVRSGAAAEAISDERARQILASGVPLTTQDIAALTADEPIPAVDFAAPVPAVERATPIDQGVQNAAIGNPSPEIAATADAPVADIPANGKADETAVPAPATGKRSRGK